MTVLSFGVDPLSTWKSVFGEESDTVDFGRNICIYEESKMSSVDVWLLGLTILY